MESTMDMIQRTLPGLGVLITRKFSWDLRQDLPTDKYLLFQKLQNDFQAGLINFAIMREIGCRILEDHPHLQRRFKRFLPCYEENKTYMEETLKLDGELFEEFWNLMRMYNAGQTSVTDYLDGVALVYKDHPEVVDEYQNSVAVDAMEFAQMVKETFVVKNQWNRFEEFVRLMDHLNTRGGRFAEYRLCFESLFGGDRDLVEEFNMFLLAHEQIPLLNHGYSDGDVQAGVGDAADTGTGGAAQGLPPGEDQSLSFNHAYCRIQAAIGDAVDIGGGELPPAGYQQREADSEQTRTLWYRGDEHIWESLLGECWN
ncbi:hypothetical protein R1flu_003523 [Riccia fluitans]|uniref:Uncharacterized protein n=1 Tax=Riccia fluitans TaxID=41844 RepID=A0ABD1Y998_9MARC